MKNPGGGGVNWNLLNIISTGAATAAPLYACAIIFTTGVSGPPAFLATRLPRARVCEGPLVTRHFPFVFIHLQTLYLSLRSFFGCAPLFSTACRLFCQNTRGVGVAHWRSNVQMCPFHPRVSTGRPDRPSDLQTGVYDQGREM